MKSLAFVLLTAVATLSAEGQGVAPILHCVSYNPATDELTAFWSSVNTNTAPTIIHLGGYNFFDSPPYFRGQPTTFNPGVSEDVFTTTFYVGVTPTLTWRLNRILATASNDPSKYCPLGQMACWDTNANGACDAVEDINGDGKCDASDCQGRTGLTGPAGTPGATGPAGLPGAAGAPGISPAIRTVAVPTTTASATASCNINEVLLNGGGTCTVPNTNAINGRIASSAPSGGNGWTLSCSAGQATAVALCGAKP